MNRGGLAHGTTLARGLEQTADGWMLFGLPVAATAWRDPEARTEHMQLCRGDNALTGWRPVAILRLSDGAYEAVRRWQVNAIDVPNRTWVDVGGGAGYFALALRMWGARRWSTNASQQTSYAAS